MWSPVTERLIREANETPIADAHRNIVEQRMLEVEEELRALKICRNTLVPVNKLPVEILTRIFEALAKSLADNLDWRFSTYKVLSWISVTHVCRHWRAIAIDDATLWTDIPIVPDKPLRHIPVMLERSQNSPLSIRTHWYSDSTHLIDALDIVHSQSHRIKYLHLTGYMDELLLSKFSGIGPELQSFILHDSGFLASENSELSKDLFHNGAPLLKQLEIAGVVLNNWTDLPLGPGLVHLHLDPHPHTRRPLAQDLLHFFGLMPLLQTLSLTNFLPTDFESASNITVCPALKSLSIQDSATSITNFLRVVQLPQLHEAVYALFGDLSEPSNTALERLLIAHPGPIIENRRQKPGAREIGIYPIPGLHLVERDFQTLHTHTLQFDISFDMAEKDTPSLTVKLPHHTRIGEYLSTFMGHMDFSRLLCLRVDTNQLSRDEWVCFSQLEFLNKIVTSWKPLLDLLSVMGDTPGNILSQDGGLQGSLPFPALTEIECKEVAYHPYKASNDTNTQNVRNLISILNARPESGRIRTLRVRYRPVFTKTHYDLVRTHVPDLQVIWVEEAEFFP